MSGHQLSILFPRGDGANFNVEYFLNTHVPLVLKHYKPLGLKSYTIVKLADDAPFGGAFVSEWDSHDDIKKALGSAGSEEIKADVKNFTTVEPVVSGGEVVARG